MDILSLPHGLHRGIPAATYHGKHLGLVSCAALSELARSPLHYRTWLAAPETEPTPALVLGAALHCAVLEPERWRSGAYVVAPDFGDCRRTENKARRAAWRREHASATQLEPEQATAIAGMRGALEAHPLASRLLTGGSAELTLRWRDAATGLECKGRADYYLHELAACVDLKTTEDASPGEFRRSIAKYGYHRQHAHYAAGFEALGATIGHFVFVAVEKSAPYAVAVYALDAPSLERGYASTARLMARLAECLERDEWPGYPDDIVEIDCPSWAA